MPLKRLSILLLVLSYSLSYSVTLRAFPKHDPVPGGIALISIEESAQLPRVFYNGTPVAIITEDGKNYALIGISLKSNPGNQHIDLLWNDGTKTQRAFAIQPKAYQEQHLTIKNNRKVNPYAKDMDRILKEKIKKDSARKHWSTQIVNHQFIIPVTGRISSIFGLKRFFNEQPRNPHSGLDIAAAEGTPVKSIESGTVIESGDFFFSGNMVYIDHGQGIISMYAHLHSIGVKTGDKVQKGQIIGTVGETGRVTGPHLHLSIIANQNLIDPALLLPDVNIAKNAHY